MKLYLIAFTVIVSFSCSTFFNRTPANSNAEIHKPRHVIVTVHGLSGNAETWGHFSEITQNYLPLINPNYEVVISHFIYPTGVSEKLSTFDFANLLNQHIESLFHDRPLQPDDKISLLAHSQGGLVSYIWFFSRILNDSLDQKYMKQVDSIITLGTPFWGSKLASMLTDPANIDLVPLVNLLGSPVTRRELKDMSFGSDAIHTFRQLAIKLDTDPALQSKLNSLPIRLINIIGLLPPAPKEGANPLLANNNAATASKLTKKAIHLVYKYFSNSDPDQKHIESDIAVMVPSARWNFIYAQPQEITANKKIDPTTFHHFTNLVKNSKFITVESSHLPFDADNTLSMAYINKSCLKVEDCKHPTYRWILKHLANCENINLSNLAGTSAHKPDCDKNEFEKIIQKMKVVNQEQYNANLSITTALQTYSVQIEMKLKAGEIFKFPVKYFIRDPKNQDELNNWKLNEPSLLGKVINLHRDKSAKSIGSSSDKIIYVGPRSERRGVDIVSRESKDIAGNDIIRLNIVGYIKQTANQDSLENMTSIPITISLPGLPVVDMDIAIQPGYSTYIPLDYTQVK
ncbi:MAG: hypothetical protein WA160_02650 [Pseudobdellovibrio sp.]